MNNLNELTILEAVEGLKTRAFTSVDLTKACLDKIKKYDEKVKAFITVTEETALQEAKRADDLIEKEGPSIFEIKPLLGIPYACKDNFSTKGINKSNSACVDGVFTSILIFGLVATAPTSIILAPSACIAIAFFNASE